jgi:hypothetical protein
LERLVNAGCADIIVDIFKALEGAQTSLGRVIDHIVFKNQCCTAQILVGLSTSMIKTSVYNEAQANIDNEKKFVRSVNRIFHSLMDFETD